MERSKSAPATTPTTTVTKSGKEKSLAQLDSRIGEYVQRASEVAKLSKTLQERIVTIAYAIEDYTKYHNDSEDKNDSKDNDCPKGLDSQQEWLQLVQLACSKDCVRPKGLVLWLALCDAKDEIVKTISDTFGAIIGLYDVIQSPPPEFEEVAAPLIMIAGVINELSKINDIGIERTLGGCCGVLDTANHRLDAAISELQWHLFRSVTSALSDDENSNDESPPTDWYKSTFDHIVAIAAEYGLAVKTFGTDWQHIASELQKKDPDAPEWEDFTEEDDDSVEQACLRYLERKWQEQINAKTDENYRQLLDALRERSTTPPKHTTKEKLPDSKQRRNKMIFTRYRDGYTGYPLDKSILDELIDWYEKLTPTHKNNEGIIPAHHSFKTGVTEWRTAARAAIKRSIERRLKEN